jgi:predicted metal-dependent hydrolase
MAIPAAALGPGRWGVGGMRETCVMAAPALETLTEVDELPVILVRKPIKTVRLHVDATDGHVWVSLPYRADAQLATDLVRANLRWIAARQHQVLTRARIERAPLADGDAIPVWGRLYPLARYQGTRSTRGFIDEGSLFLPFPDDADAPGDAARIGIAGFYKEQVQLALAQMAPGWEALVGRGAERWTVRSMTTRWGSCNSRTRRISMNLQLAAFDPKYFEETLVHELVHLWEPNHGPRFYARMDALLPTWRVTRREMRRLQL